MNKWKEFANIFDLDLNEPFTLFDTENFEDKKSVFCISEKGLMVWNPQKKQWDKDYGITSLIEGRFNIRKKPFPSDGDEYFYFDNSVVKSKKFESSFFDLVNEKAKNMFKTKDDALNGYSALYNNLVKEHKDSCGIFPQKLIMSESQKAEKKESEKPLKETKQKVNYIEIWEPKYSTNSVLIATYKVVNGINRVIFTKAKRLADYEYEILGSDIKKCPTQENGNILVYVVPLSAFKKQLRQKP